MLKRKAILIILLLSLPFSTLFALEVLVAKERIKFKEKIKLSNLRLKKVKSVRKSCIPTTISSLSKNYYISTHYINPGSIICEKDIKLYKKETVLFNFGNIEIEREGKVIGETTKYIRIKKPNGRVEKIFKNGSLK